MNFNNWLLGWSLEENHLFTHMREVTATPFILASSIVSSLIMSQKAFTHDREAIIKHYINTSHILHPPKFPLPRR